MAKNILIFALAFTAIAILIYMGIDGMLNNSATGAFFTFTGTAAAIGFSIDVVLHIRNRIRRNALRKLGL